MRFGRAAVVLLVSATVLAGTSTALAQPPSPPPNPSDEQLEQSRDAVADRAGRVGRLTADLAALDARTEDLQIALAGQRESAEAAMVDLDNARAAAAIATRRAQDARTQTDAATVAIDDAAAALDEFLTMTYQEGLDAGPLGLLTAAESPEDLVARAEFTDAIVREQVAAQERLERARVDKANADAGARAALEEAQVREAAADAAKTAADEAFAAADTAARESAAQLAAVDAERAEVQRSLDEAAAADSGLRDQRDRYEQWQQRLAEEQAARDRAEQAAAEARVGDAGGGGGAPPAGGGGGSVSQVIDRALSQLGVQYVWGGGNGRGPSTGIPDAFGSPLDRVGFDCSGLMLYAFNGVGVPLPRVSRNQYDAGRKVPVSEMRAGDMVFYKKGSAPIHHVALYIGDGQMVEAPYTGSNVRVVPLRRQNLLPQVTRML